MFNWLKPSEPPARTPARTPTGMRLYAVGDIHGRADLLIDLRDKIARDAAQHPSRERVVIYLGDYVDRGPQSRDVLEVLSNQDIAGLDTRFLMGNHEQTMLGFLADPVSYVEWFDYGGLATLASYEAGTPETDLDTLMESAAALRAAIPAHQMEFLRGLEFSCRYGDYFFVHAGILPRIPIDVQHPQDMLWIREEFLGYTKPHPLMVVHGHNVCASVDLRPNRIGIDTGAYATGCLTCLILDGTERLVINTQRENPVPLSE